MILTSVVDLVKDAYHEQICVGKSVGFLVLKLHPER